jgi:hypothetical protein
MNRDRVYAVMGTLLTVILLLAIMAVFERRPAPCEPQRERPRPRQVLFG